MPYLYEQRKRPPERKAPEAAVSDAQAPVAAYDRPGSAGTGASGLDAAMRARTAETFGDLSALRQVAPQAEAARMPQVSAQAGPYSGPVTRAMSNAAPSPAAAGPIQAKRKSGNQQAPEGRAAVAHMEQPLAEGQLDVGQMDFGNKAYKRDRAYQSIAAQMQQYNSIDENEDRQGKNQAQIALMTSAMDYIEKHSGGKTAKHRGRTAHLEKLLYDLSMKGGTAQRADANLGKLRNASEASDASADLKQGASETISHLQGVYGAGSQYSPAMQMITAGVLADQNASGAADPIYVPQQTRSAASGVFAPGSTGYSGEHNYTIVTRTSKSRNDAIGTMLHELTHVASGEDYQNAGLMTIGANATDEETRRRALERIHSTEQIYDALGTAKTQSINEDESSLRSFATDKLSYAVENKLPAYEGAERTAALKPLITRSLQSRGHNEELSTSASQYNSNIKTLKYLLGQGPKPQFMDRFNAPMEDFQSTLTDVERTDLQRIQSMSEKQRHVAELMGAEQNDPKKRKEDENKKKAVRKLILAKRANENDNRKDFVDMELHGSNALVEHDSIMNQLLLQYENAGISQGNTDRDSLFYRRLRNAALKAHVQRQIAKLSR